MVKKLARFNLFIILYYIPVVSIMVYKPFARMATDDDSSL
jgi:hypothetical protein